MHYDSLLVDYHVDYGYVYSKYNLDEYYRYRKWTGEI